MWFVTSSSINSLGSIVISNLFVSCVIVCFEVGVTLNAICYSIFYKLSYIWVNKTSKVALDETEDIKRSTKVYESIVSFICNTGIVVFIKNKITCTIKLIAPLLN